jgi:hypothetical protein
MCGQTIREYFFYASVTQILLLTRWLHGNIAAVRALNAVLRRMIYCSLASICSHIVARDDHTGLRSSNTR